MRCTPVGVGGVSGGGMRELWDGLLPIGRDPVSGGYRRHGWDAAELECRAWFRSAAADRDLAVEEDRDGNLWAWWGRPGPGAVVTGSHLDSVPDGGAYDGPLGVVSALAAVDLLRARGVEPRRPFAVAVFAEEEGSRFGIACLGSRLLTGQLDAGRARALVDRDGVTLERALTEAGADPAAIGPDEERVRRLGCFVELHVEQGRALVDLAAPVGVGSAIWPHGRWRFDFAGVADHAGTTRLADRRDPMLTFANTVLSARKKARLAGMVATIGRVEVTPNGTNAIPSLVRAWLDARAPDASTLADVVAAIEKAALERGERDGVDVTMTQESSTPETSFDAGLVGRVTGLLGGVPVLPTGAGHDAGVLATAGVPTVMLFVRNPTGVSHSPAEHAEWADCEAGAEALATVLEDLVTR
ncbi:MAG TPA: allantoate amidohydrolase [Streptosporangiales bacterium]